MTSWQLMLVSLAGLVALAVCESVGAASPGENDARARRFLEKHEAEVRPLEIRVNLLWWDANTTGKDEAFAKKQEAETRLDLRLSDRENFAELKAIHQGRPSDPLLARQIDVLYRQYLSRQIDPELLKAMLARSNAIEQAFNVYRAKVGGKELSQNDVRRVLRLSEDSAERKAVWEASKDVGRQVEAGLKALVKLRNQAAHSLGFKNYHAMSLYLNEQDQEQVIRLFDELDALTREPFHQAKAKIDAALARQCGVTVDQLRPWHYHDPFFQEPPAAGEIDLEPVYAPIDVIGTCRAYFAGIGLEADDVLARSDLFEKPGKSPHAFSTNIDREGDVRVLANVVPGREWLGTMLHELGHAVYSKYVPPSVPYVLRDASHPLTTEGVAMMFEANAGNPEWLRAMGVEIREPEKLFRELREMRRAKLLIFARWCQVMLRFEKAMYEDPEQDLNRLWWDLVEKYQELRRPEGRDAPDYASKMHLVAAPAYYHNYMMGEMFAAQLHEAIVRKVLPSADPRTAQYAGRRAAGEFVRARVFAPGATMDWNTLTRHATGEALNPRALAKDLQERP